MQQNNLWFLHGTATHAIEAEIDLQYIDAIMLPHGNLF